MTKQRLTPGQKRLLADMQQAPLFFERAPEPAFHCVGRVNSRTVRSLVSRGLIIPNGDSLFGETQTYRLADANQAV